MTVGFRVSFEGAFVTYVVDMCDSVVVGILALGLRLRRAGLLAARPPAFDAGRRKVVAEIGAVYQPHDLIYCLAELLVVEHDALVPLAHFAEAEDIFSGGHERYRTTGAGRLDELAHLFDNLVDHRPMLLRALAVSPLLLGGIDSLALGSIAFGIGTMDTSTTTASTPLGWRG